MKPTAYIPPALYPESAGPDNVPAFVLERPFSIVHIWHKDGALHANARATAERYRKRGWLIKHVTDKRELIVPCSIPVPTRRAA